MISSWSRATWALRSRTFVLWFVVALMLIVPVQLGLAYLHEGAFVWRGLLASFGLLGLLVASSWLTTRSRVVWTMIAGLLLTTVFFLRMLFFGLTRFSGRAFDDGFFLSLQGESVSVAWHQYLYLFVLFGLGLVVLLACFVFCARHVRAPAGRAALILALSSAGAVAAGHQTMPAWQLVQGMRAWYEPVLLKLPAARRAEWKKSPLVHLDLVSKQALKAQASAVPKNLILLYIESGGVAMAPADRYPDLMPNMKRLIEKHSLVPHIHASSYVTIEGLVNTQCGTLLPFANGNDSVATFGNRVDDLPCLGDVLSKAGYLQSYLGGSGKSFSGKGPFLKLHGYDKVMGLKDWTKMGIYPQPNTWGLSDVDLFKQSFAELKQLKASGHPFNLTMLTIGTHLPGFVYKECKPYGDGSKQYLNAVSCTDQLIGQWVERLQSEGWLDENTILVITGDHQIFPNPLMKQLFGEQAVEDHRLPLIVIGKHAAPALHDGAGYDIPPTILDLLGVKTNAQFALGRSLMRHDRTLDYYPARYVDMLGEERYAVHDGLTCDAGESPTIPGRTPGDQPLNPCERKELGTVLKALAVAYSAKPAQLRCGSSVPLRVLVPGGKQEPLQLELAGQDLAARFTSEGRHINATQAGLYILRLDTNGTVVARSYMTPGGARHAPEEPPTTAQGALIVAWRPGDGPSGALPAWLAQAGVGAKGGTWMFSLDGKSPMQLRENAPVGQTLTLSGQSCLTLLH